MSFISMADEITLESLTEEQFECFIEYYHEDYPEDYKSDLENLEEVYKMMTGGVEYRSTHNTSPSKTYAPYNPSPRTYPFKQPSCLGSTFVSEALKNKLPKSQSEKTYKEDLKCEIVMIKMPKCMPWLDAYDELIGIHIAVTYPEEVDETIGISMEAEPLDHMKLKDLGLNTCNHDIPLSYTEIPSVDEPKPQLLSNFSPLDINIGGKRGTDVRIVLG
ncbi:hypothetical protein Tco_0602355 [Tanacetum coccineum]